MSTIKCSQYRHHASSPLPDKSKGNAKYYAAVVWEGMRHMYHGFRLFYINTRLAWKYASKLREGTALTRRERALLERATGDLLRLVPFSLFIIVPGGELLLPVALKMFPELIPSTFETEAQGRNKTFQKALANTHARKRMNEYMTTQVLGHSSECSEILRRASCGDPITLAHIQAIAPICSKDGALGIHRLPPEILFALSKILGVWKWYYVMLPKSLVCSYLRKDVINFYRNMRQDDQLLIDEGLSVLSKDELVKANFTRGMRWTECDEALTAQLEVWIKASQDNSIPYNTLFWIKPTANSLHKTMTKLPVETRRQLLGISNLPESVRESLERVVDNVSEKRGGASVSKIDTADTILDTISEMVEADKIAGSELDDDSLEVCQAIAEHLTPETIDELFKEITSIYGKVRVSEVIEYLATDIHQSSHMVSNVFDILEMGKGSRIMTRSSLQSVATRCRSAV